MLVNWPLWRGRRLAPLALVNYLTARECRHPPSNSNLYPGRSGALAAIATIFQCLLLVALG